MKDAAGVDFGERVFEVLRDADFLESFVGKLFGEDVAQLLAIAFAREIAGTWGVFEANDFHALGLDAAEAFDGEGEVILGITGDRKDAAGDVTVFRPQMQQGLLRISPHFPGERRCGGDAAAVFADFDGARDKDVLKAGAQVFG
jgi:hypothetical protein